jgi:hypothetical protein
MDSEKKYKEALERARKIHNQTGFDYEKGLIEEIFPELRESEDEKTRKRIIALVTTHGQGMYKGDMLAWLEKHKYTEDDLDKAYKCADEVQYRRGYEDAKKRDCKAGEQKPVVSDDALREGITHFGITQYQIDNWLKKYVEVEKLEQKTADKVEPKFKVGDWCIGESGYVSPYDNKTMETNELSCKDLMVGDWMRIKVTQRDTKVINIAANNVYTEAVFPIRYDEIEPIHLTPEILENNGFHEEWDEDIKLMVCDSIIVEIGNNYKLYTDGKMYLHGVLAPLYYVHEFQHALRICNIEKEIKL